MSTSVSAVSRGACVLVILCLSEPVAAQDAGWKVTGASVRFEVRNAGFPVRGTFEGLDADVCLDPDRPEVGTLFGAVDPATIRTGIALRDRHLQRRDWFHVERYGQVELRSVHLWKDGGGFAGDFLLRIRDVERSVKIPFAFEADGRSARIRGTATIDRLDFGLGKPSIVLADSVTVEVEVTLSRRVTPVSKGCR